MSNLNCEEFSSADRSRSGMLIPFPQMPKERVGSPETLQPHLTNSDEAFPNCYLP